LLPSSETLSEALSKRIHWLDVNGFQKMFAPHNLKDIDLAPGKQRLGRVAAMLSPLTIRNDLDSIDKDSDKDSDKDGKTQSEM
jgi:hypothetical protein